MAIINKDLTENDIMLPVDTLINFLNSKGTYNTYGIEYSILTNSDALSLFKKDTYENKKQMLQLVSQLVSDVNEISPGIVKYVYIGYLCGDINTYLIGLTNTYKHDNANLDIYHLTYVSKETKENKLDLYAGYHKKINSYNSLVNIVTELLKEQKQE